MELLRSLQITLAEEVLSVSGLVLLLVAAWGGDKASRLISILSVAVLTVCALRDSPQAARDAAFEAIARIRFRGMHYRRDIAARAG